MVPVPIPDTYTVPQSYQPRRPDPVPDAPPIGYTPAPASERTTQPGPIPFVAPAVSSTPAQTSPFSTENWSQYLAVGAFLAAGALLLTGHRRLGIVAAAAGVASVLLEDREDVAALCHQLPGFLSDAQALVGQVEQLLQDGLATINPPRA